MKNKKGFLLGEYTLKVIIAVLCLLLLFYLLFRVYSNSQDERELQMAEAVLEDLSGKMVVAKENSPQDFVILGPNNWALLTYVEGEDKPLSCEKNCICFCAEEHGGYSTIPILKIKTGKDAEEMQVSWCNKKGVCKEFNEKIKKFDFNPHYFEGEIVGDLEIKYKGGEGFRITKK